MIATKIHLEQFPTQVVYIVVWPENKLIREHSAYIPKLACT